MRTITVDVIIDRPADEVYAYLEEVENNPHLLRGMRSARWITPPPVRVGSTYEQHARFLGKDIRTVFEVTALDPPRSITITSRKSPFPLIVTRQVSPVAAKQRAVREVVDSDPAGFYRSRRACSPG